MLIALKAAERDDSIVRPKRVQTRFGGSHGTSSKTVPSRLLIGC